MIRAWRTMKRSEITMKLLMWLVVFRAVPVAATQEKQEAANQEVSGTIKEVSINVRRLIIETTQHQEKTVSVEPETRILSTSGSGRSKSLSRGNRFRLFYHARAAKRS